MDFDGANEKELTGVPSFSGNTYDTQIATSGKGIIDMNGYFLALNNGVFAEANSFYLTNNETKNSINQTAISDDASKLALLYTTTDAKKLEIRVKDVKKDNVAATTVYTVSLGADIESYNVRMLWVNGNKNILVHYGKFTGPKGAASDYTKCEMIDVAAKTATNFTFTGDKAQRVVVY